MLKPKEMQRILVVGPKNRMEVTIEALHSLEVLHIMDFKEPDEDFSLGTPLEKASEISENLVKLRSISSVLDVEEGKVEEEAEEAKVETEEDLRGKILTLELNINEEDMSKKELEEQLRDTKGKLEAVKPFAVLGLPFEFYLGYKNLSVFVGTVGRRLDDLNKVTTDYELVTNENMVALFVHVKDREKVESYLSDKNFAPLDIPEEKGNPAERIEQLEEQQKKFENKCIECEDRLGKLRKKHAKFILEAEEHLAVEIDKAEAPLRFATTAHSFIIDGWIPKEKMDAVQEKLNEIPDLHVEVIEPEIDEAPVLLNNPKPSRPFEFLIHLFSTPSYKEIDPTLVVFIIFPIFFGFMIGDAGYGVIMILLGYLLFKKLKSMPALQELGVILIWGGIFALVFGLFLFGEVFAIPYHEVVGSELPSAGSWSEYLGINIPYYAPIHKLENIEDLLLLSIVGAAVHLGVGYVFGIVNEWKHNKKHAIAKLGWFIVLFALFLQLMLMAQGTRVGGFMVNNVFVFVPMFTIEFSGITISIISVIMIVIGIVMFVPAEGPIHVLEIVGLAANILSYTRLAGIAVAKGAVALAFNVMLVPLLLSGNIAYIIMGAVFIFLAHAMILILGSIASGIQALRLNYVEFFLKFYKGTGHVFEPFGKPKKAVG